MNPSAIAQAPSATWFCAQIGAREHYAVPRALHQAGKLGGLYLDFWAGPALRKFLPDRGPFASLAARFHPSLTDASVRSYNVRSLGWEFSLRRADQDSRSRYLGYAEQGRKFASAVAKQLIRRGLPESAILFSYDTGALEAFAALRPRGVRCVLGQIDPNRTEVDLVRNEEKCWAGWVLHPLEVPEPYFHRREQEWALADRVVVNSEFARQALIRQGVPEAKMTVVPICYEPSAVPKEKQIRNGVSSAQPLRVLFLGQVILRKGIQYLMEAARLLRSEPVEIAVVGPIGISPEAVRSAPTNLVFHGRAPREDAARHYHRSDLFVLPTISDGFALVQLEAMAHGLPVVATPNCGEVVTDGVDGLLIPPRDPSALAQAILRYAVDRDLLQSHQRQARLKAGQFTLERLGRNLAALESE